jgi:hypothetical protein
VHICQCCDIGDTFGKVLFEKPKSTDTIKLAAIATCEIELIVGWLGQLYPRYFGEIQRRVFYAVEMLPSATTTKSRFHK